MKKTVLALALLASLGAHAASFSNGSFEDASVSADSQYVYGGPAAGWSFGSDALHVGSGVAFSGAGGFGGTALGGSVYAFLQGPSTISQTFTGNAGAYTVSFSLAQRTNAGVVGAQKVSVMFDGQQISLTGQTSPLIRPSIYGDDDVYGGWMSYAFTVTSATAGNHTLAFFGTGRGSDDTTVFLDNVSVTTPVPEPETYALMLAGLGLVGAVVRRRKAKHL